MAQTSVNRMETPIQLAVEKDQEQRRAKRRRAAKTVVAQFGYEDNAATRETLAMLGLDDPSLRRREP